MVEELLDELLIAAKAMMDAVAGVTSTRVVWFAVV
jgi:hypothetical protein